MPRRHLKTLARLLAMPLLLGLVLPSLAANTVKTQ